MLFLNCIWMQVIELETAEVSHERDKKSVISTLQDMKITCNDHVMSLRKSENVGCVDETASDTSDLNGVNPEDEFVYDYYYAKDFNRLMNMGLADDVTM